MASLASGFAFLAAGDGHVPEVITEGFLSWAPWIILFLPLAAALTVLLVPTVRKRVHLAAACSIGSMLVGLVLTLLYFFQISHGHMPTYETIVPWVDSGDLVLTFGTRMDHLALIMTFVVTGVGSCIFI